jgi:peptide/nickel transport system permease protein
MRFIIRRISHGMLLLAALSILCFVFTDLAPGTYFDEMKVNPQISPETVEALKSQFGLDKPVTVRYWRWLKSISSGELGYSFAYNTPVKALLGVRVINTLILTGTALLIVWVLAVPLGITSAARPQGFLSRTLVASSSILLATPELVVVLVLLSIAVRTGILPIGGMNSNGEIQPGVIEGGRDLLVHLVIPVGTLVIGSFTTLFRHVRSSMIEALEAPYVLAATSHGVRGVRVLLRHALPAAANPLIALFGLSIAGLLSGSLVVEVATGWPGLGPVLLGAIIDRDQHVIIAAVMVSGLFMIAGNLIADVLLFALDPRVRRD